MKSFKGLTKLITDNFKENKFRENKDLIIGSIKTRSIDANLVKDCVNIFYQKKYNLEAVEIINYYLNNVKFDEDFIYILLDILVSKNQHKRVFELFKKNRRKITFKGSLFLYAKFLININKPKIAKKYFIKSKEWIGEQKLNECLYLCAKFQGLDKEAVEIILQLVDKEKNLEKKEAFFLDYLDHNHFKTNLSFVKNFLDHKERVFSAHYYFSLFKYNHELKNFSKACEALDKANDLYSKNIHFNISSLKTKTDKLFSEFDNIDQKNESNQISKKIPIFIVGLPRSGSTLVETFFLNSRDTHHLGEVQNFSKSLQFALKNFSKKDIFYDVLRRSYLDLEFPVSKKKFVIDKNLFNFFSIGFMLNAFPDCKVIHVYKKPEETLFSLYKTFFLSNEIDFVYKLNDICNFMQLYNDVILQWNLRFPKKILHIQYENLVDNFESSNKKILSFCGIEKEVIAHSKFDKSQYYPKTKSSSQLVGGVSKQYLNVHKNYYNFYKKEFERVAGLNDFHKLNTF